MAQQDRSITTNLKKLSEVRTGQHVSEVASSERMNAIQEILKALCRGDNVGTGVNIRKRIGSAFFTLSSDSLAKRGASSTDTETPFQVVSVAKAEGDDSPGDLIGVTSNSHLFNSEDRNTYEEDNSDWELLEDDVPPGDSNAWANNYLGDKIYLQIEFDPDDQSIVSIDVRHGQVNTGEWPQYPDPIEINTDDPDNPYQQYFYQIIAEITDPDTDPRPGITITNDASQEVQVTQLLLANLMMTTAHTTSDADEPGLPLLVAIPWSVLPGTSIDGEADEIPSEDDLMTPWQLGTDETSNDYNFELFNASEPGVAKVLVLDGVVYGPNNDGGVDPDGMPSDDTFTLEVADEDEIWLEIDWSGSDPQTIDSVSIDNGATTPDDTEDITYITIGSVSVDDSGDVPIVSCRNELCGDAVIELPPYPDTDSFVLMAKDGDLVWEETDMCGS